MAMKAFEWMLHHNVVAKENLSEKQQIFAIYAKAVIYAFLQKTGAPP